MYGRDAPPPVEMEAGKQLPVELGADITGGTNTSLR
jgi:hypothetical protein